MSADKSNAAVKRPPKPVALYPTYAELVDMRLSDYPDLKTFLQDDDPWRLAHWEWGKEFLLFIGRNKSEHTFIRFRGEVERFLGWTFLVRRCPMDSLRKTDILDFADFCWKPPINWIGVANVDKFLLRDGRFLQNKHWSPFKLKLPKHSAAEGSDAEKKKYRPSQQTLMAMFTAVIAFYKYLMNEEKLFGNPAQMAKPDCRHFIKDSQVKEIRRLTEAQWQFVYEVTSKLADEDCQYERSLFIICALKVLFLRISELSERSHWSPMMSHFWQDLEGNWWLKVYGKGRKIRDITVPPDFLEYLKRYRQYRALPSLPAPGENHPIVEKIRGQGGMTARQLTRIVQEVFDKAYQALRQRQGEDEARKLLEASTHWLRHTGASMEVERGRALKDLSEDLGHASMATTDTIYVQTESKKRAASGKNRKVN